MDSHRSLAEGKYGDGGREKFEDDARLAVRLEKARAKNTKNEL